MTCIIWKWQPRWRLTAESIPKQVSFIFCFVLFSLFMAKEEQNQDQENATEVQLRLNSCWHLTYCEDSINFKEHMHVYKPTVYN